jgi:putative FmdB family regulatory protein
MPIYEYRCDACGHQEEFLQRVSEPPLTECPVCRKPTFQKLLSAAGFQLKGSGWYATDFKNKASKPADKKTEGKTEDKADSKTDSKPDAKPEKKPESESKSKSEAPA